MTKPNWTPIKIRLGEITTWQANPRMSTKAQAQRIIESEKKFNQVVPFILSPSNVLYDGHQRLAAWLTVYGADHVMDAIRCDRELTEAEHKELVITLHSGATGQWDWQVLSGWSAPELKGWGMDADTLRQWNLDALNLREMINAEEPIDYAAEWAGMPEFEQEDLSAVKSITVNFISMGDYETFAGLVGQKLTEKTRSIWYPQAEKLIMDRVYKDES